MKSKTCATIWSKFPMAVIHHGHTGRTENPVDTKADTA